MRKTWIVGAVLGICLLLSISTVKADDWVYLTALTSATNEVRSIAVDDDYVYYGGKNDDVFIASKSIWEHVNTLYDATSDIYSIAVDDDYVYYAGELDSKISIANKNDLSNITQIDVTAGTYSIAVDDDYVYIGGHNYKNVQVIDKTDWGLETTLTPPIVDDVWAIVTDDNYVYIADTQGYQVHVVSKSDWSNVTSLTPATSNVWSVAVDSNYVYIGGFDQKVHVVSKSDWSTVTSLTPATGTIYSLAVDDDYVYIGGSDKKVHVVIKNTDTISDIYKYYAVVENCYASSDGYASASCSVEIPIPKDCINIKTKATTIIDWDQTAYNIVNDTFGFTRFTCNPDTGDYGACDNDFNECSYFNFNTPNTITYYNYEGGQTAKAWFLLATGGTCISDGLGTPAPYNITGVYVMEADCLTSSGIVLPNGTATGCEKIKTCHNSNTMLIVDENCLSTYINCPYGCENGICLPTTTTTLKNEDSLIPLDEDDLGGAGGLISVIFTPFFIGFMFLFGIASILEYQTRSKGAVFTLTVLGGSLALGFVGIFPLWLAILLACLSGGVFAFLIRKGVGGG